MTTESRIDIPPEAAPATPPGAAEPSSEAVSLSSAPPPPPPSTTSATPDEPVPVTPQEAEARAKRTLRDVGVTEAGFGVLIGAPQSLAGEFAIFRARGGAIVAISTGPAAKPAVVVLHGKPNAFRAREQGVTRLMEFLKPGTSTRLTFDAAVSILQMDQTRKEE